MPLWELSSSLPWLYHFYIEGVCSESTLVLPVPLATLKSKASTPPATTESKPATPPATTESEASTPSAMRESKVATPPPTTESEASTPSAMTESKPATPPATTESKVATPPATTESKAATQPATTECEASTPVDPAMGLGFEEVPELTGQKAPGEAAASTSSLATTSEVSHNTGPRSTKGPDPAEGLEATAFSASTTTEATALSTSTTTIGSAPVSSNYVTRPAVESLTERPASSRGGLLVYYYYNLKI